MRQVLLNQKTMSNPMMLKKKQILINNEQLEASKGNLVIPNGEGKIAFLKEKLLLSLLMNAFRLDV